MQSHVVSSGGGGPLGSGKSPRIGGPPPEPSPGGPASGHGPPVPLPLPPPQIAPGLVSSETPRPHALANTSNTQQGMDLIASAAYAGVSRCSPAPARRRQ